MHKTQGWGEGGGGVRVGHDICSKRALVGLGHSHECELGAVDLDHIHVWEGLVSAMWRTDRAGRGREVGQPFITETGGGSEDKGGTR